MNRIDPRPQIVELLRVLELDPSEVDQIQIMSGEITAYCTDRSESTDRVGEPSYEPTYRRPFGRTTVRSLEKTVTYTFPGNLTDDPL